MASVGRLVARLERLRLGRHGRSKLLTDLSFGPFNKRFAPNRTAFDWLSRDTAQVGCLCRRPTLRLPLHDAILGRSPRCPAAACEGKEPRSRAEALPLLIFSGDEDPVGVNLSELVKGYRGNGMSHVAVRLYAGGRHEMLNEINRNEVQADVLAWLEAFLAGHPVASPP